MNIPLIEFIEKYCIIEDKDAPQMTRPFKLWRAQKEAVRSIDKNRMNIILKARQLGLTWLCIAYALWRMLKTPGYTVIALSRTEEEAKELTRRMGFMLRFMGELVSPVKGTDKPYYKLSALSCEIVFDDISSTMRSFASSQNAGRSFTANLLFLDEWAFQQYDREIWLAAFPTVNRPKGGKVIGISTMARGSLFEELYSGDNAFNKIFLPWNADPRRTKEWYESTKDAIGDMVLREYPASVEEAFSSPGGSFFPELRRHIHTVEPCERQGRWYVAIDYGLDMLSAGLFCVDAEGFTTGVDEVNRSGLIISDAAAELLKLSAGREIHDYFAPPDLWNRSQETGRSKAEIFAENGIFLTKTSNAREDGWLDVKEHLKPFAAVNEEGKAEMRACLTFERGGMEETYRCLSEIKRDKRNENDAAREPHSITHAPDMVRCFCAGRPAPPRTHADMPREKLIDRIGRKKRVTL